MKIKESEKLDKYPDLARELKTNSWNMNVTVTLMVVWATTWKKNISKIKRLEIVSKQEGLKDFKYYKKVTEWIIGKRS